MLLSRRNFFARLLPVPHTADAAAGGEAGSGTGPAAETPTVFFEEDVYGQEPASGPELPADFTPALLQLEAHRLGLPENSSPEAIAQAVWASMHAMHPPVDDANEEDDTTQGDAQA